MRITRTSWQKYLPPNCAPMPILRVISRIVCSISRSRKARPNSLPLVCRLSRYLAEASFTVFRQVSAEVPPMASARWYGGHAAVPSDLIFASMKGIRRSGVSSAFVSWKRYDLLAEPPPFAMNINLYWLPGIEKRSICAGRLVFVFTSSYIDRGAFWL